MHVYYTAPWLQEQMKHTWHEKTWCVHNCMSSSMYLWLMSPPCIALFINNEMLMQVCMNQLVVVVGRGRLPTRDWPKMSSSTSAKSLLSALINNNKKERIIIKSVYSKGFVLPSWARFSRRYNWWAVQAFFKEPNMYKSWWWWWWLRLISQHAAVHRDSGDEAHWSSFEIVCSERNVQVLSWSSW